MPPSSEPVKRQVIVALQTLLKTIDGSSTYWHTVEPNNVRITDVVPSETNSFPTIFITPMRTGYDSQGGRVVATVSGQLQVQLTCLLCTAVDVSQSIERMIHDVHTVLYSDRTLGGVAIDMRVTGDESMYPMEADEPVCGADIFITIDYRAKRTDLTTTQT